VFQVPSPYSVAIEVIWSFVIVCLFSEYPQQFNYVGMLTVKNEITEFLIEPNVRVLAITK